MFQNLAYLRSTLPPWHQLISRKFRVRTQIGLRKYANHTRNGSGMYAKWFAYVHEMVRVFRVLTRNSLRMYAKWFAYFAYVREMVCVCTRNDSRIWFAYFAYIRIILAGFCRSSRILINSHGILCKFAYFA